MRLLLALLLIPSVVAEAPVAGFEFEPAFPEPGETVWFNSTSTDNGTIVSTFWNIAGDRQEGTSAQHVFFPGSHVITLTVIDDEGLDDTARLVLEIEAPVAQEVQPPGPSWAYWLFPLVAAAALAGIAAMVLLRGTPTSYNRVFFAFFLISATKSVAEVIVRFTADFDSIAFTVARMCAYLMTPLFVWFVLIFPRPAHPWLHDGRRGAWLLLAAVPFAFSDDTVMFNVFASLAALSCIGILWYHARDIDSDEERNRIRWLSMAFMLIVVVTIDLTIMQALDESYRLIGDVAAADAMRISATVTALIINPIIELIGAMVLLYAILRYQLLGVEKFVSRITKASIVAIAFPFIFIVVGGAFEELLQNTIFAGQYGFIFAGIIATAALFPMQKLSDHLVARMFPQASDDPRHQAVRRMEIFEAQLRYSLLDDKLDDDEVPQLRTLSERIGLTDEELSRVLRLFPSVEKSLLA